MDQQTLFKYFSRQLSAEENRAVRKWVEQSPENLDTFMSERALFDCTLLADIPCNEDVSLPKTRKPSSLRSIFLRSARIAALVAATIMLTQLFDNVIFPDKIPMNQITVPSGQQLNIVLADGTSVWLNSNSTLSYPAVFSGKERRVSISGKGFFDVARNESHPFIINTGENDIEVLGTTFDVEAYGDSIFQTTLIEGKVKIMSDHKYYYLNPGEMAKKKADGSMEITNDIDPNAHRWTEGIISLNNDSFEEIISKFEKFFGIRIIVERKTSKDISYSGSFYISDGVVYALEVLRRDIKFNYEIDNENHIIYVK